MNSINRRTLLGVTGAVAVTSFAATRVRAQTVPTAPTPQQWAKSPAVANINLSPSGNRLAYISEEDGNKILYDFDLTTKQSTPYNMGTAKIASLGWIDDDHILVVTFVADKLDVYAGGQATFKIATIFNLKTRSPNILFHNVDNFAGITRGNLKVIDYKGERQVVASAQRLDSDDSVYLYRFALDNDRPWPVDRGPAETLYWVVSPGGEPVGRSSYSEQTSVWMVEYYRDGTWKTIYSTKVAGVWPTLFGLGRDGKTLVVYMSSSSDQEGNYYEMSADGSLSPPLTDLPAQSDPIFDPITFRLCGFSHEVDGWPSYQYYDTKMQALVKGAQDAVEGYRMVIADRADDPHKMIVYSEGADDAGTYYYIDFVTGKVLQIGSQYPDIPTQWITSKTAIKYKAADGLDIEAFLTLPPNRTATDLPLVVFPHGGPEAQDTLAFDWEVQAYASLGYAVLQPNYRGSTGYGQAFIDAGNGEWGRKMQTDLSDGVRFLTAKGVVDAKRVCIVGASYGGYAALAGAAFDPGVYNCAVDIAGISDLKAFLYTKFAEAAHKRGVAYRIWQQRFGQNTDLDAISPIRNVARIDVPVLIIHGKADTVVDYSQSSSMADALKAAGKTVEFVPFVGQNHWEMDETSRIGMMTTIASFLQRYNPA